MTLRRAAYAALLLALAAPLTAPVASANAASTTPSAAVGASAVAEGEVYGPTKGYFYLTGRGFGHGRGMSQYGAAGRAAAGMKADQILSFYYPNTTLTPVSNDNRLIRVYLEQDDTGPLRDVRVKPKAGLSISALRADGTAGPRIVLPTNLGATDWRVRRFGTSTPVQTIVEYLTSAGWKSWRPTDGTTTIAPDARGFGFTSPSDNVVEIILERWDDGADVWRPYSMAVRGTPRGLVDKPANGAPGTWHTIVYSSMRDYLRAVVPAESFSTWPAEALKAQTVAARTYAVWYPNGSVSDICSTTTCQVYAGLSKETAATNAAVDAVKGQMLLSSGVPINAEFSSSNGGWTAPGASYVAKAFDAYDDALPSSRTLWTTALSTSKIQTAYCGTAAVTSLTLTRDGFGAYGGRVTGVRVGCGTAEVEKPGEVFRRDMGLSSTLFTINLRSQFPRSYDSEAAAEIVTYDSTGRVRFYSPLTTSAGLSAPVLGPSIYGARPVLLGGNLDSRAGQDLLVRAPSGVVSRTSQSASFRYGWAPYEVVAQDLRAYRLVVVPGDVNGDGLADLLGIRTSDGTAWLLPGTAQGTVGTPRRAWGVTSNPRLMTPVGDLNKDGWADLVVVNQAGSAVFLPGSGNGRFEAGFIVAKGWTSTSVGSIGGYGDVTGDGVVDVVRMSPSGEISVAPGKAVVDVQKYNKVVVSLGTPVGYGTAPGQRLVS